MSNVHHSAGKRPVRPAPAPPRPSRGAAAAAAQVGGGGAAAAATEIASIARALTQDQDVVNMAKYAIYVMSDITGTKIENPQKAIEAALNMLVARGATINNGKIELTADRHEIFACNAGENRSQTGIAIVRQLGDNRIIKGALAAKDGMFSGVRAKYHEDLKYYYENNNTEKKLVYGHTLNTESQETINAFAMQLLFDHTKEIAGNGEKEVETLHAELQKARDNEDRPAISAVYEKAFDHYAELFHKESAKPLGITAFTDIAGINLILNLVSLAQEGKVTLENVTLNLLNIDDPLGKCSDVSTTNIRLKKEAFESYEIKDKGKKPFKVIDTIAEGIITTVLALEINSKIVHNSSDAKEAADTMIMEKLKVLINTCFDKSKLEISEPETKHLILKTAITHLQNQPKLNPSFKTLISQIATNILPSFTVAFPTPPIYNMPLVATAAAAATGGGGGKKVSYEFQAPFPPNQEKSTRNFTVRDSEGNDHTLGLDLETLGLNKALSIHQFKRKVSEMLGIDPKKTAKHIKIFITMPLANIDNQNLDDYGEKILANSLFNKDAHFRLDFTDHPDRIAAENKFKQIAARFAAPQAAETGGGGTAEVAQPNPLVAPEIEPESTKHTFNIMLPTGAKVTLQASKDLTAGELKKSLPQYEGYKDFTVWAGEKSLTAEEKLSDYGLDTKFCVTTYAPAVTEPAVTPTSAAAETGGGGGSAAKIVPQVGAQTPVRGVSKPPQIAQQYVVSVVKDPSVKDPSVKDPSVKDPSVNAPYTVTLVQSDTTAIPDAIKNAISKFNASKLLGWPGLKAIAEKIKNGKTSTMSQLLTDIKNLRKDGETQKALNKILAAHGHSQTQP